MSPCSFLHLNSLLNFKRHYELKMAQEGTHFVLKRCVDQPIYALFFYQEFYLG